MREKQEFWAGVQAELAVLDPAVELKPAQYQSTAFNIQAISFTSLYAERIRGILIAPKTTAKVPLVIDYLGYTNFISDPTQFYHWPAVGCACLVIDNRGQGGATLDQQPYAITFGTTPMGQGFLDPQDFYMKRVVADHLLEVQVGRDLPMIDADRIFLRGGSQGGGLAVMVGALTPIKLKAIFADVPSQSNLVERIKERAGSYGVLGDYLELHPEDQEKVFAMIRYFDTQYFASQISAPIYCSVGDQDTTCPPADFQVTYDRITAPKELKVYHGHAHEGGGLERSKWEVDQVLALID
ncbi:acetylxylan esterase [Lapidilactobacillus achengensis]|uniref:Acetylxylan esterase n=1 Tax=Lapidilactobacillus achengensis TaxID=2486000 RepID=A0ABW1UPJ0_9LACO|nr:acetylxylan esterase [Lapidilactobacillus achengensis]